MKRILGGWPAVVLAGLWGAGGCGDTGKPIHPKAQGPADPAVKPLYAGEGLAPAAQGEGKGLRLKPTPTAPR